jgi:hypothetical protein
MRQRALVGLFAAAGLLGQPQGAGAFSFLGGGFAPGEEIVGITLAADLGGTTPTVSFDTTTNKLTFSASVSEIETTVTTYSITIGTVLFDSQLDLSSEFVIAPTMTSGGFIEATFADGMMVDDLTITDVADAGNVLLAANYSDPLDFSASRPGGAVTGSFSGDFDLLNTSDPGFKTAFGDQGNLFANLSNFISNGTAVTDDLCELVAGMCIAAGVGTLDDFTVNPTVTIRPLPEPAGLALIGGLVALGMLWLNREA